MRKTPGLLASGSFDNVSTFRRLYASTSFQWRRGESNPGPSINPQPHLRAYPEFYAVVTRRDCGTLRATKLRCDLALRAEAPRTASPTFRYPGVASGGLHPGQHRISFLQLTRPARNPRWQLERSRVFYEEPEYLGTQRSSHDTRRIQDAPETHLQHPAALSTATEDRYPEFNQLAPWRLRPGFGRPAWPNRAPCPRRP
jgi:hypothetical protein